MNILLATPSAVVRDEDTHINLMDSGTYNDGTDDWWLYLCTEDVTADYPGSKLIGIWNYDGTVATDDQDPPQHIPIDSDYLDYIRPMGNDAGAATDSLNYHYWAGNEQRHLQAEPADGTLPQYPANRQPYVVKVERTYIDDDGFPQIPHGFTFTIEFADPSRAPDARSFGVYSDEACTQYLWTPGAFVSTDTGEVDENDDPIFKWTINCPVGQRTADESEWHFAMLFGSAQEGRFTLPIGQQTVTLNFFDKDQGEPDGGEVIEWAPGQSVAVGDLRIYNGSTYECLQAHTTQAGWTPVAVPALWALV